VNGYRDLCGSFCASDASGTAYMCVFDFDFLGDYSVLLLSIRVCACGKSGRRQHANSLESD
jgi:hypothetical protein